MGFVPGERVEGLRRRIAKLGGWRGDMVPLVFERKLLEDGMIFLFFSFLGSSFLRE